MQSAHELPELLNLVSDSYGPRYCTCLGHVMEASAGGDEGKENKGAWLRKS